MHNIKLIQHLKRLQQLPKNDQSLALFKGSFPLDSIIESTPIAILIHKVVVIACLKVILVLDYVFRRPDCLQCFDLVDCALF